MIRDIMTVFGTSDHKVIGSRYERSLYVEDQMMFDDFSRDINLQFETYEGKIKEFVVVVITDDEEETRLFNFAKDPELSPFDIIDYAEQFFDK